MPDEKILKFNPSLVEKKTAGEPISELVEELEKMLVSAKAGKLQGLLWASVFSDGASNDGGISCGWVRGPYTNFAMTAAMTLMCQRWTKHEFED